MDIMICLKLAYSQLNPDNTPSKNREILTLINKVLVDELNSPDIDVVGIGNIESEINVVSTMIHDTYGDNDPAAFIPYSIAPELPEVIDMNPYIELFVEHGII